MDIWMGWLTRESGKSGYACMGDRGRAWGIYQFDYRYALVDFLTYCLERDPAKYAEFRPYASMGKGNSALVGNAGLRAAWTAHASQKEFCDLQDEFSRKEYYEPAARYLLNLYGIDAAKHSAALRGSLFSFSIRSGQLTGARKFSSGGATEAELLRNAYAKYGQEDAGRWPEQLADALAALEEETPAGKRNAYVAAFESFYGLNEGDGSHKAIIDLYNTFLPHPRGYKAQYTDAWCAEAASAAAIKAGVAKIFPIECGCEEMIEKAKASGIWIEDDAHVPIRGELVLYDWDDDGSGDNTGHADHIGAVVEIEGRTIKVIEGNKNNMVGYRRIDVNSRQIRGYISPRYEELDRMGNRENLRVGSNGPAVEEWQDGLMALGFCDSNHYTKIKFKDGDFAGTTERFTKEFQEGFRIRYGLTVDGKVDAADWAAMDAEKQKALALNFNFTIEDVLNTAAKLTRYFYEDGFTYGNPPIAPWWCPEKKWICCDRFIGWLLFLQGINAGNRDAAGLKDWLPTFCEKITDPSEVRAGDIVFTRNYEHVFLCAGANKRYDCGRKERIRLEGDYEGYKEQPFTEPIEDFSGAFRLPVKAAAGKPEQAAASKPAKKLTATLTVEEVKLGSSGQSVRLLQTLLKGLGYYVDDIDGYFGTATDTAVREYQADKIVEGLPVGGADGKPDGEAGAGTWSALLGVEVVVVG